MIIFIEITQSFRQQNLFINWLTITFSYHMTFGQNKLIFMSLNDTLYKT